MGKSFDDDCNLNGFATGLVRDFEVEGQETKSGALLQWQRELDRIQSLRQSGPKLQGGLLGVGRTAEMLPDVEIIDSPSGSCDVGQNSSEVAQNSEVAQTNSESRFRGSPESHAYATRILSESGGDGTLVAQRLLQELNNGTFLDRDENVRPFLMQSESGEREGLVQHSIGTVYHGPTSPGELHMRSVINDVVQKLGMELTDEGQLSRLDGELVESDPAQVARFNSECLRAFNAGETSFLFQIREMTDEEIEAADTAQQNTALLGTYHRALIILAPAVDGDVQIEGVNGSFIRTDYIPEPLPHMTN